MTVATDLLQGLPGGGGPGFIDRQTAAGGVPNPTKNMRQVLIHWCTEKPEECTKMKLYQELKRANPSIAMNFKTRGQ